MTIANLLLRALHQSLRTVIKTKCNFPLSFTTTHAIRSVNFTHICTRKKMHSSRGFVSFDCVWAWHRVDSSLMSKKRRTPAHHISGTGVTWARKCKCKCNCNNKCDSIQFICMYVKDVGDWRGDHSNAHIQFDCSFVHRFIVILSVFFSMRHPFNRDHKAASFQNVYFHSKHRSTAVTAAPTAGTLSLLLSWINFIRKIDEDLCANLLQLFFYFVSLFRSK